LVFSHKKLKQNQKKTTDTQTNRLFFEFSWFFSHKKLKQNKKTTDTQTNRLFFEFSWFFSHKKLKQNQKTLTRKQIINEFH